MKRNVTLFFLVCAAVTVLSSCATSIPVVVTRPAELDLHGAKTVAVLPFQISNSRNYDSTGNTVIDVLNAIDYLMHDDDRNEVDSANYLTSELTSRLAGSPYLTLVDSNVVKAALENGKKAPVDAYLTGKIINFEYGTDSTERKEKVEPKEKPKDDDQDYIGEKRKNEERERYVTYFKRWVRATVVYEVVDAKTNAVIGYRTKEISDTSAEQRDPVFLTSPFDLIDDNLSALVSQIVKDVQPYEETKYLSLLKDKDPELKTANQLAKEGLLDQSEQKFYALYKAEDDFVAGYNAAKLLQAQGKLTEAKALMSELVDKFADKRAMSGLRDIQYEIDQAAKLQSQLSAQQEK